MTYQKKNTNKTRQIDLEFFEGIFNRKSIIECKFYESSSLNLEETLKQLLSAKKFTKANSAYLVTNKNIKKKDEIYSQLGIKVYDKTVLDHLNSIRGQEYNLETQINNTQIPTSYKRIIRYI